MAGVSFLILKERLDVRQIAGIVLAEPCSSIIYSIHKEHLYMGVDIKIIPMIYYQKWKRVISNNTIINVISS
jgi:hypothetical protein